MHSCKSDCPPLMQFLINTEIINRSSGLLCIVLNREPDLFCSTMSQPERSGPLTD